MTKKFLHTCVRVKDLEASLDFYTNALGFKVAETLDYPDFEFTLVYLELEEGGYQLELTYNYDQEESYDLGNGYGHIAVGVDKLEEVREELIEAGYEEQVGDVKELSDGAARYFFITDPDGYKIEVIQN